MRDQIELYVRACPTCQLNKQKHKNYKYLPPKEAEVVIWDKMCINPIGSYKIHRKGQPDFVCKCVTMIDPASGWFEIHQYDNKR